MEYFNTLFYLLNATIFVKFEEKSSKCESEKIAGQIAYFHCWELIENLLRSLYVCMVNTIYLFGFVETPRKFIIAIINLRGVSTKLNKYNWKSVEIYFQLGIKIDKLGSKIYESYWPN